LPCPKQKGRKNPCDEKLVDDKVGGTGCYDRKRLEERKVTCVEKKGERPGQQLGKEEKLGRTCPQVKNVELKQRRRRKEISASRSMKQEKSQVNDHSSESIKGGLVGEVGQLKATVNFIKQRGGNC